MKQMQEWVRKYWAQLVFCMGAVMWIVSAFHAMDSRIQSLEAWRVVQETNMALLQDVKNSLVELKTQMELLLKGSIQLPPRQP